MSDLQGESNFTNKEMVLVFLYSVKPHFKPDCDECTFIKKCHNIRVLKLASTFINYW
jgi:hypothetical protein